MGGERKNEERAIIAEFAAMYEEIRDRYTFEYRTVRTPDAPSEARPLSGATLKAWCDEQLTDLRDKFGTYLRCIQPMLQAGEVDLRAYVLQTLDTCKALVAWRTTIQLQPQPAYFYETRVALLAVGDWAFSRVLSYEMLGLVPVRPAKINVVTSSDDIDDLISNVSERLSAYTQIAAVTPVEDPGNVIALPIGKGSGIPEELLRYELVKNECSAGFFLSKDDAFCYARQVGWGSYRVSTYVALQPCDACGRIVTFDALSESLYRYGRIQCKRCLPLHRTAIISSIVDEMLALPSISEALACAEPWFERLAKDFGLAIAQLVDLPPQEGIYALEFPLDDGSRAVYVGQSEYLPRRVGDHLRAIIASYYGANRPSDGGLMRELAGDYERYPNSTRVPDFREGIRQEVLRRYPYAGYLRSSDFKAPFWQSQVATEIAVRLGPRVQIRALEMCNVADLLTREAWWQRSFKGQQDVLPLWVANTDRCLPRTSKRSSSNA